jgi:hypothetical protein
MAAIVAVVNDRLTDEVRGNETVGVREPSRRRNQNGAVRHKFRPPDYRGGGRRQLGIAGENKAPIVDPRLPRRRLRSRRPLRAGRSLSGTVDCAVETPTRIRHGRAGSEFRRRLLTSNPVSSASVISTSKRLYSRDRRHIHIAADAEVPEVRTRDAPRTYGYISARRRIRDAAHQFAGGRSRWRYPVSVIQRARAR